MEFQSELKKFQGNVPAIRSLSSRAIKDRHWVRISSNVNSTLKFDDTMSFASLLDNGVANAFEPIGIICSEAEKEYNLERAIDNMKVEWKDVILIIKAYRETQTFVVGGIDDIVTLLDDQLVKIQTIRSSPFIKPLETLCRKWESQLKYSQVFLDQLVNYQKSWMYLEPIFSSEDINKQLPSESKRFQAIDTTWRKFMDEFFKIPNFMHHAEQEKLLSEQMEKCNRKLDEIQKGLSEYLETKRMHFPRFFFLSDNELIEILSQTKDPRAVQPHLNKCFEGINQIGMNEEFAIDEMCSSEGEKVQLCRSVDCVSIDNKGKVEKWLLDLQYAHWDTMFQLIGQSLRNYLELERKEWILNWPAQVILAVSQIYWTEAQETALANCELLKMKNNVKIQNQQLNELVHLVRGKISKLNRKTLGALMTIDVHARDISSQMIEEGVQHLSDFGWISVCHYYLSELLSAIFFIISCNAFSAILLG